MSRATLLLIATSLICGGIGGYVIGIQRETVADPRPRTIADQHSDNRTNESPAPSIDDPNFDALQQDMASMLARGHWNLDATWQQRLDALTSHQLSRLADHVIAQPPSDARGALRRAIYASWARIDPQVATHHAHQIENQAARRDALRAVMRTWAFTDIAALEHWVRPQPASDASRAAVQALLGQVGELSPATLFTYGVRVDLFTHTTTDLDSLLDAWVRDDPLAAATALEQHLPTRALNRARDQLIRSWIDVDPATTLAWVESIAANQNYHLMRTAFESWAQTDPHAAAERALQLESLVQRKSALGGIAYAWASQDIEGATHWIQSQPSETLPPNLLGDMLIQFAGRDASRTIEIIQALPTEQRNALNLGSIITILGDSAPDEDQVKLLLSMPLGYARNSAARIMMEKIAQRDPARALQLAKTHDLVGGNAQLMNELIGTVARSDAELALAEVQQLPDTLQRNEALAQITKELATQDPELAAIFAGAIPASTARDSAFRSIASSLVNQQGGAAALEWADDITDPADRSAAYDNAAQTWIQNKPGDALAWLNQTTDPDARRMALEGFAKHWPRMAPDSFVQAVLNESDPEMLQTMLSFGAGRNLASRSTDLAMTLVQSLPPGDLRDRTLASVASQLITTSPQQAMDLARSLPAGPMQSSTVGQLLQNWGYQDPANALQWLQSQPAASTSPENYGQLAASWFRRDSVQAGAWLQGLPTGAERDAAISAVGQAAVYQNNFDQAAPLITSIGDAELRSETLQQFTRHWLRQAPRAATEWINQLPLPPEQKDRLLAGEPPGS